MNDAIAQVDSSHVTIQTFDPRKMGYHGWHNGDGARLHAKVEQAKRVATEGAIQAEESWRAVVADIATSAAKLQSTKEDIARTGQAIIEHRIDVYA